MAARILLQMLAVTDVETDVLQVLEQVAGRPVDGGSTSDFAADLGFDSIKTLEFVAALEDHFEITIPLNELPSIKSVPQVVDHMSVLLSRQRKVDGESQDPARGSRISSGPE